MKLTVRMQVLSASLWLFALLSCGPQNSRYEVKLKLGEYCKTLGAEHLCDSNSPDSAATDLFVEVGDNETLIIFQGQNYLSANQSPLFAERRSRDEDANSGCTRERRQRLELEQGFWEIHGSYEEEISATGPGDSCGDRPSSERWTWPLEGPEKEGP